MNTTDKPPSRVRYSTFIHPETLSRIKRLRSDLQMRGEGRVIDLAIYHLIKTSDIESHVRDSSNTI